MILLVAILVGLAAGLGLARLQKRSWMIPHLRKPWLVVVACLSQFFGLSLPARPAGKPDWLAAAGLILSMVLLLVFCWFNRRLTGVWLLALGLACNLLVMAANGGLMPISPQTASRLVTPENMAILGNGGRFGYKDILLLPGQSRLTWLSDRFLPPEGFPYQVAVSLGDLFIAAGVFLLLVTQGRPMKIPKIGLKNDVTKESKC